MDAPQPVLIYDGRCRFCVREASRLARWVQGRVRLESFREPGVIERYPGLTHEQCEQALQLIEPDGRIRSGAEAVACTLRLNPRIAPLTWIYYVPLLRSLFDLGYRTVARNRFRLRGEVCTDETCGVHQAREPPPGRTHLRDLFLRLLGLIFLVAFLSLLSQVDVLYGSQGLLPMQPYLDALRPSATVLNTPTLLWLSGSDTMLRVILTAGALLSLGLIFNLAPLYCLIAAWGLYVSFGCIGQTFLGFQWDNLLLETAFFSFFITPAGLRPKPAPPPHPIAIFMMQWLLFRLHVESGAAKLLSGDPTWRDLTAMVNYYETAPLPTWVGWYVHQLPIWAHELCALFTFVVELVVPFLIWGPRKLRVAAFVLMVAMQISVILTANYGFFNYLSLALCLFVLDDGHLSWVAQHFGRMLATPPRALPRGQTVFLSAVAAALIPVSVILFAPFYRPLTSLNQEITPLRNVIAPFRSLNIYHLFASMTLIRREVVIEGSSDGTAWLPYEFRYKPGDVDRPPPFVAPHQPRVDFQLWFLLLRGRQPRDLYFHTLIARLFHAPQAVAPLFARDPFPDTPPKFIRLAFYRYRFTDWATRRTTGAWWQREPLGYSKVMAAETFK